MSSLIVVEHDEVELERDEIELGLDLLIREARRRKRRRRLTLASLALAVLGLGGVATGAVGGWFSAAAPSVTAGSRSAGTAGARCPASPARMVANSVFTATVLGTGPVRLGVGNVYETRRRKIVVVTPKARSWGGIEAIWVVEPGTRGPISVRGVALAKQGPIAVQPSGTGPTTPGASALTLPAASPLYPGAAYPGSLWVRAGGCYALAISGRGFSERLVFAVQTTHSA